MLITIDELGSKNARHCVFDCHLLPNWHQMATKNSVSNDFLSTFGDSTNIFDCRLPSVFKCVVKIDQGYGPCVPLRIV